MTVATGVRSAPRGCSIEAYNRVLTADPGEHTVDVGAHSVEGAVPRELAGARYLLNGPARLRMNGHMVHPFDGHGFVRSFRFRDDGGVSYRSRFVDTAAWRAERDASAPRFRGIGTKVPGGWLANLRAPLGKNVANTTVYPWAGKLFAGWEGGAPHRLDAETLATEGPENFRGALEEQPFLAHVRVDEARRRLVGLTPLMGRTTTLVFREFDEELRLVSTHSYAHDAGLFVHDFVITEHWYVLGSNALKLNLAKYAALKAGLGSMIEVIEPDASVPGYVLLVPRDPSSGRKAVKAALDAPFFVVHHANAFEDRDGNVVLDTCAFESLSFERVLGYAGPSAPLDPTFAEARLPQRLQRIVIDPRTGRATRAFRTPHGVDFTRVHPSREGKEHRYVVGAANALPLRAGPFDALACADMSDPERPMALWRAGNDVLVGEPVFAPRPGGDAADELDGWLLAVTYEAGAARSSLCVFDARDLERGPVARVPAPALFPYGFHGAFIAAGA